MLWSRRQTSNLANRVQFPWHPTVNQAVFGRCPPLGATKGKRRRRGVNTTVNAGLTEQGRACNPATTLRWLFFTNVNRLMNFITALASGKQMRISSSAFRINDIPSICLMGFHNKKLTTYWNLKIAARHCDVTWLTSSSLPRCTNIESLSDFQNTEYFDSALRIVAFAKVIFGLDGADTAAFRLARTEQWDSCSYWLMCRGLGYSLM